MASVNSLRAKSIFGDSAASQVWRDGDTYQLWGLGLAGRFSDSLIEFDHQDATGSINMTTASNGAINGNLEMDAYGDLESATGNLQWGQTPYRYIGGLNCQSEALAAFGGGTSGGDSYRLVLMGERWYDPQAGRFISRDPVFSENLYAYCGNDPINSVDPEGRWQVGCDASLTSGCGVFVGAGLILGSSFVIGTDKNGDILASATIYGGYTVGATLLGGTSVGLSPIVSDENNLASGHIHNDSYVLITPYISGSCNKGAEHDLHTIIASLPSKDVKVGTGAGLWVGYSETGGTAYTYNLSKLYQSVTQKATALGISIYNTVYEALNSIPKSLDIMSNTDKYLWPSIP